VKPKMYAALPYKQKVRGSSPRPPTTQAIQHASNVRSPIQSGECFPPQAQGQGFLPT